MFACVWDGCILGGVVACLLSRISYGLVESASKCVRMWRELLGSGLGSCSLVPVASLDMSARVECIL
jgi:hypothetical protein